MHRKRNGHDHRLRPIAGNLFQQPDFGYFFLRLTTDRLLQNMARMEGLLEQYKGKLQAAGVPITP